MIKLEYYQIDDLIAKTRSQIMELRREREEDREMFTEDQAPFAKRQYLCLGELQCLMQPKTSTPTCYTHAIQDLSSLNDIPYIVAKETSVCHVLHQVEITTNQLRILVAHHGILVNSLKRIIQEEIKKSESVEESLLKAIKVVSMDMAALVTQKNSILDQQKHHISHLRGEISPKGNDLKCLSEKDCSSVFSTSAMVSALFRPIKQRTGDNERMNIISKREKKSKAIQRFGIHQTTATAA
mmetsp:Transcript_2800/g.4183  ORF Transcript_2800/g.4183 Transcript_2800/m.4183 type:complete len:240 (-) Transcript_2800:139-858(-)|eukprot:CAMPEP_0194216534 /NCGR_PEP_ID=MMETSP0156-20130528/19164_1 /TAXON_ID=33649 /ORGANISM="Thalassionema nitzschioides, Strain L26-B" /LENGTH=239 /DNA_ID=CAMNT_0038945321 /DNA_START=103 /DNA_END=822 /DNA_ORIENTATION=-